MGSGLRIFKAIWGDLMVENAYARAALVRIDKPVSTRIKPAMEGEFADDLRRVGEG